MTIRRATHTFVRKVKYLQNMFRLTYSFAQIVRRHVLTPQIWAMESWVIGEAVGINEEMLRSEIADALESKEVECWKQSAYEVAMARHRGLHSSMLTHMAR